MKSVLIGFFISVLLTPSWAFAVTAEDILGLWITEGGQAQVRIFQRDGRFFAKIVAMKYPNFGVGEVNGMDGKPRVDIENPDKSLRSRPLIGLELMKNFRFQDGKWVDGKIYDPANGKSYKCKMSLGEDGKLHVRGYIGITKFGRTTIWEPAEDYMKRELKFLGLNCTCDEEQCVCTRRVESE